MTMTVMYCFDSLVSLADHCNAKADDIREQMKRLSPKSQRHFEKRGEASAWESIADTLRNTTLGPRSP